MLNVKVVEGTITPDDAIQRVLAKWAKDIKVPNRHYGHEVSMESVHVACEFAACFL